MRTPCPMSGGHRHGVITLFVEVVSNHYLAGDDRLTDADGTWLESHGWKVPDPPKWPNWSMVEATTSPAVSEIAGLAIEAMRAVFGLADADLVLAKLFPSQLRGDSPASPDPRDDTDSVDPVTPSSRASSSQLSIARWPRTSPGGRRSANRRSVSRRTGRSVD